MEEEAAAAAAAMASSLPEDVLLEILFRLKDVPAALFRCATACIRWHGLVAEPAFLRRCWPDQDVSSSILGFFTQQFSRVPTPRFTPMPRSAIHPRLRSLGSFIPAAPTGVFDGAAALVSRHGLLLVRLDTTATRGYANPIVLDLAVCNLLTGACHMLPALKFGSVFDECEWNGYAILTGADCRSSNDETPLPSDDSSFFKVVIISSYRSDHMNTLHMFSSEEGGWTVRTDCFDGVVVRPRKHRSSSRAVVRRGTAHWLIFPHHELSFSVLNLNMRTGDISLTKLPLGWNHYLNGHHPFLTLAINGALSLLWMHKTDTQLEIWEQQEEQPNKDGGSEWVCGRTIELKLLGKKGNNEVGQLCILGQTCGTLLIHNTRHGVYTADLETGMMQEVVDWPRWEDIYPRETVPLEVDWPTIFASRLVTRKQKMENQVTYPPGWELMYLGGNKRRKTKSCMSIFKKRPI